MAGYAARNKPSEGVAQELFARGVAFVDPQGNRLVSISLDLIGVPRWLRLELNDLLQQRYGLSPQQWIVNASHTHCGPELRLQYVEEGSPSAERQAQVERYQQLLKTTIVELVGQCLEHLQPVHVGFSFARCGFAMNRRHPGAQEPTLNPYPDGPVDHQVPVLRVVTPDKQIVAILFSYACHNTTLSFYQLCGDYAGYAQEYLEQAHPGCVAAFLTGCAGDQNPYPRGSLELAQQHGRTLANAVEAALLPAAEWLTGPLKIGWREVTLHFAPLPSRDLLMERTQNANRWLARHARYWLEQLNSGKDIDLNYPYWIQLVDWGGVTWIALSGEVVVDYSLRLKRELPNSRTWILGYSNDVFGYVPSLRVLREGGYEGRTAMYYTRLPGPFAEDVEELIIQNVHELYREVHQQPEP
ncbi:MAG: hypothetical protein KatS3mg113_0614 [Planctomycetaceae bacterium]|nr:MAG: hypothetical protein KatS3mg113_0614 [Planctomycetaceae bacterium]